MERCAHGSEKLAAYLPGIAAAAALADPAQVGRWILSGTAAMTAMEGGRTCEDVFWDEFCRLSGGGASSTSGCLPRFTSGN